MKRPHPAPMTADETLGAEREARRAPRDERKRSRSFAIRPVPRRFPLHLRQHRGRYWKLYRWANMMRGLFGRPVYLCGSALRDDNADPRDWDVRIMLPDAEFARRYGPVAEWVKEGETGNWTRTRWRWSDDCVKYAKAGWRHTALNIDFQVYPASHARERYAGQPKLRLDTRGRE